MLNLLTFTPAIVRKFDSRNIFVYLQEILLATSNETSAQADFVVY